MAAVFLLVAVLAVAVAGGEAALVEHTFVVSQMKLHHLCHDTVHTVVNGQLPGPTIEVTEGDSVAVHVINKSPHPVTIHWHGVKQQLNCWADGPAMITQCPIQQNKQFAYRFNVTGQEGTLWWHAHVGFLRATVHGVLIIRPRSSPNSYPFPKPDKEIPVVIGEWWDIDVAKLERDVAHNHYGNVPRSSTLNGKLGDLNNCSGVIEDNYILNVEQGKTYMLRIVNVAFHNDYYFKIAGHNFTVVGADANYVKPYTTEIIAIAPGESVDALVLCDAPPGKYYMVALAMHTPDRLILPKVMSRGILHYNNNPSTRYDDATPAIAPEMPLNDEFTPSFFFHGNLTSLPHPLLPPVPLSVDERLIIATDTGYFCKEGGTACRKIVARMNNISFVMPTTPLLQAHYYRNMSNVVNMMQELPSSQPAIVYNEGTVMKATSFRRVKYNTTLEIIFQGPPQMQTFPNPMHLHGHDVFIVAHGIGTYEVEKHVPTYNLVDPPARNTVDVPRFGWTAIRFVARNPGVWFFHCHFESHAASGMAMVLVVEDGPTPDTALPPPPADFPSCDDQSLMADE